MSDDGDHGYARVPEALDVLVGRLGELRVVFGDACAPTVAAVEDLLRQALAARDGGDPFASVDLVAAAMERLAALADSLGGEAGQAMRLVVRQFRGALLRGHETDAREAADIMRRMAGSIRRPPDD
jgi:hypothetical protein